MTNADQKDESTNYSETTDSVYKTTSKLRFRSRSPFKSWLEYLDIARGFWKKPSRYQSIDDLQKSLQRRGQTISYRNSICREVFNLCVLTGENPDELVGKTRDCIEKQIQKIVDQYLESPNYACTKFYLLKAFFKANGFEYEKDLKVQLPKPIPYSSKRSPMVKVEDVVKMAESRGTSLRDRSIIHMQRCGGFRASDVTALRFGRGDSNLPKSSIKEQILEKRKNLLIAIYPQMKKINPSACKNNTPYYGFTDTTGTKTLIDYLIWRIDKYGFIPDDAPLFATEYNRISLQKRNLAHLGSREICLIDKKAAVRARIENARKITAKSIRMLFRQLLRNQLPENQIEWEYKEFLMGHRIGKPQESYFNVYDTDRLRAEFSKLDLMHSPIFEGEQKEKEDDQALRINKDFESAYSELIEKIKAMENVKQKQLFNPVDPYPTYVELGDEKLHNSTIEEETQSLQRKEHKNLLDYFHTTTNIDK